MSQISVEEDSDINLEDLISEVDDEEEEEEDDEDMDADGQRAVFSMAFSVVATSVIMELVPVLSGILVGIALWFIVAVVISNVFKFAGWKAKDDTDDELSDIEVLKMAYKRDLITEEQLEQSLELKM